MDNLFCLARHPITNNLIIREYVIQRKTPKFVYLTPVDVPEKLRSTTKIAKDAIGRDFFHGKQDAISAGMKSEIDIIRSALSTIETATTTLAELRKIL